MRILGIDPGLKATGYGLIDYDQGRIRLVETGVIQSKQRDGMPSRLQKIYTLLEQLIDQYRPDILVLEKLYAHYRHPTTASVLGHVRGIICLVGARKQLEFAEHSAKRIRKAVTGNGNASKQQTQRVVAHLLNIESERLTLDASDALALALGYVHIHCRRI